MTRTIKAWAVVNGERLVRNLYGRPLVFIAKKDADLVRSAPLRERVVRATITYETESKRGKGRA